MEEKTIKFKSCLFAVRIIEAYKYLSSEQKELVLSKQMLRSGTAIGTFIKEAEFTESSTEYIDKLNTSLLEAIETEFWLKQLYTKEYLNEKLFQSIVFDCEELMNMLTSIINTSKNLKNKFN